MQIGSTAQQLDRKTPRPPLNGKQLRCPSRQMESKNAVTVKPSVGKGRPALAFLMRRGKERNAGRGGNRAGKIGPCQKYRQIGSLHRPRACRVRHSCEELEGGGCFH